MPVGNAVRHRLRSRSFLYHSHFLNNARCQSFRSVPRKLCSIRRLIVLCAELQSVLAGWNLLFPFYQAFRSLSLLPLLFNFSLCLSSLFLFLQFFFMSFFVVPFYFIFLYVSPRCSSLLNFSLSLSFLTFFKLFLFMSFFVVLFY